MWQRLVLTQQLLNVPGNTELWDVVYQLCNWLQGRAHLQELWSFIYQRISCILWNSNFHYHIHKNPPRNSVWSEVNRIPMLIPCFFRIHFYIIPPTSVQPSDIIFYFLTKHCVYFWTQLLCYMFCLCHSSLVYCSVGHKLLWNSIRVHAWVSLAFVFLSALSSAVAVCVHVCYYSNLHESSIHCCNTECFEIFALLGCYTA